MDTGSHALLLLAFNDDVDRTSRAMFEQRLNELGWRNVAGLGNTYTLEFEPRSVTTRRDTVASHLKLAAEYARIVASQRQAAVHFGDSEPASM